MTLVLALRCREGAVLAADDQLTYFAPGAKRVTRKKLVTKLLQTRGIAWGWSGDEEAQQRFGIEVFEESSADATLSRSEIRQQIESACRTSLAQMDSDVRLELLVGWWSPGANKALLLRLIGAGKTVRSTFVDDRSNVEMVGSPDAIRLAEFSLRTLGFGDFRNVGMEEAKIVASKVISDVSAVADDVGQPSHIIGITEAGVEELDAQDVEAIASSAGVWTVNLRATLAQGHAVADHHEGHRPPAAGVARAPLEARAPPRRGRGSRHRPHVGDRCQRSHAGRAAGCTAWPVRPSTIARSPADGLGRERVPRPAAPPRRSANSQRGREHPTTCLDPAGNY